MNPMKSKERQDTYHYGQNLSDRIGQILTHSFTFTCNKLLFPKSRHLSFKCHEDNMRVRALFSLPLGVFFYSPHFILQDKFSLWKKSSHFCWLVSEDPEPTLLQTHTIMAHFHVDSVDSVDSNPHPPSYTANALNLSHHPSHPSAVMKNT